MNPRQRDNLIQVRASDEEILMLRALADESGLSASDVVRLMIRDSYKSKFGDKKPPRPKK